jgi:hypothetical protein
MAARSRAIRYIPACHHVPTRVYCSCRWVGTSAAATKWSPQAMTAFSRTYVSRYLAFVGILFAYSLCNGISYLVISRTFGWGVYESEFLVRCVHLLPALALTVLLGLALRAATPPSRFPRLRWLMATYVAFAHFLSYPDVTHIARVTSYQAGAAGEALLLFVASIVAYNMASEHGEVSDDHTDFRREKPCDNGDELLGRRE